MRAILCDQWGDPQNLRVGEAADPDPAPDRIRIRVRAAALNFADILMVGGSYQEKPPFPFSPGMEVAGENVATGERVMAVLDWGGFAEYAVAAAADVMAIPDSMSFAAAAALPVAYGTAHMALAGKARLQKGESLIVHGASGGVGLAAIDVGRAMGAKVVAVTSGAEKISAVLKQGADEVVDYRDGDLKEQLRELLPDGGNVYFDAVGGDAFDASLRSAAPGGRILVIGFAAGQAQRIPANILMVKNVTAIGFYWGAHRRFAPGQVAESFRELLGWVSEGRLRPFAVTVFKMKDAAAAMNTMQSRRSIGKIVLTGF